MNISSASISSSLQLALLNTGMLQVVEYNDKLPHFWILCRIIPGQEAAWLGVVERILGKFDVSVDLVIARRYVLRSGKMLFGWHIGLVPKSVKHLASAVDMITAALKEARPALPEPPTPPRPVRAVRSAPRPQATAKAPSVPAPRAKTSSSHNALRVVQRSFEDGRSVVIEEMGLPHTYRELNVPNEKGKGAELYGKTTKRSG
jgi:hypothetical protein